MALRDAFASVALPLVEVHVSNVHKREEFRHHSYISGIADGVIAGLGVMGYSAALVGFMIHSNQLGKASFTAKYGRK